MYVPIQLSAISNVFTKLERRQLTIEMNVLIAVGGSGRAPIGDMRNDQRQSGEGGEGQDNEFLYVSGDQLGMLVHTI